MKDGKPIAKIDNDGKIEDNENTETNPNEDLSTDDDKDDDFDEKNENLLDSAGEKARKWNN